MKRITLNGEAAEIRQDMNLLELIKSYRLRPEHIAVELNREIVPQAKIAFVKLEDGDKIEIVHMVGGGI